MKDFDLLDTEGQAARLENLAKHALLSYGLKNPQIRLIKHEMNTVFKVNAINEYGNDEAYILRIHPEVWLDKSAILSEMLFLNMLSKESDLLASQPVPTIEGEFVQELSIKGVPGKRCCVLMKWIEGEFYENKLNEHVLLNAGKYLGMLHDIGSSFNVPDGFTRPCLDFEGLFGKEGLYSPRGGESFFTPEQSELFKLTENRLEEELKLLGKSSEQFGFIHGDFYFRNIIDRNGVIGAIDFDLCGNGYFIFDMLMPYWPENQGNTDEAQQLFFRGYKQVRAIPRGINEYKGTFNAMRRLMEAYWIVSRKDHPFLRSVVQYVVPAAAEQLRSYVGE